MGPTKKPSDKAKKQQQTAAGYASPEKAKNQQQENQAKEQQQVNQVRRTPPRKAKQLPEHPSESAPKRAKTTDKAPEEKAHPSYAFKYDDDEKEGHQTLTLMQAQHKIMKQPYFQ
jgi:hypothetical protein